MSQYEITFLLNEEQELTKIKTLVEAKKGKLTKENDWGVKELSYPIKKSTSAHFYNWEFSMDVADLAEFKKSLNFSGSLTRYLILRVEGNNS